MLPAGLGLGLETPTLLAALDPSESFTLPAALDLCASSITPAALDPSANTLLSVTLDSHSARPSNLSADHGLHSASCFNLNKTCSAFQLAANEHKGLFNDETAPTFRLIVRFKQQYQSKMQQNLVNNFWLSNATLIANLETSNDFQQRVMPSPIHQLIVK
jgi:hypothetical protein